MADSVPPSDADAPPTLLGWLAAHRLYLLLATVGALALVAVFFAGPATSAWNHHRARTLAEEAIKLAEEGKWEESSKVLNQAFVKNPNEPVVLRAFAQFIQKGGTAPERALHFWRQLLKTGAATLQDRASMGECYILSSQSSEARKLLEAMSPAERVTRPALELESSLLRSEGRIGEAAALLRRALLMEPDNPECILKLATLDLNDPFSEVQSRALEMLWSLARGTSPQAVPAIQILAAEPRLTASSSQELLQLALKNGSGNERLRYAVLSAMVRLLPLDREKVIEKEAQTQKGKPLPEQQDFLRWLYSINEQDRILQIVPPDMAARIPEIFPLYVESLASKKRWADIRTILRQSPTLPITPVDLELLKARLAEGEGGSPNSIKSHLEEACRRAQASRDTASTLRAIGIAEGLGYDDVALENLRKMATLPQNQLTALEKILAIQTRRADTKAMLSTLTDITSVKPDLRVHQENILYLKLLIGVEMETTPLRAAAAVSDGRITTNAGHMVDALSAFRMGDIDALKPALAAIDPGSLTIGQRAVYAGMLSATGETSKAFAIAERVQRALLLNEEARFLNIAL